MDVKIALTGFGNVGQGLATLLADNAVEYEKRYGVRLLLTGVTDRGGAAVNPDGLDPRSLLDAKLNAGSVTRHGDGGQNLAPGRFLEAAQANILVEAASTNFQDAEPGWSYVRAALERRMDVVLASKGCLALYWSRLFDLARREGRAVLYSATVGAPVPGLQMAERVLVGTRIDGFDGILNGTTHQILTSMSEGSSYEEGVKLAQEMGIAETDPTLDVDGWDAAAKVAIVANTVYGTELGLEDVEREGIRAVTASDLALARQSGERIKLIASARRGEAGVELSVKPARVPADSPLGRLRGDGMGIVFYTVPTGTMSATFESGGYSGGLVTAMTCLRDVFNLVADRGGRL